VRTGSATGFQIVFLSFAVILLAVPLSGFISRWLESSPAEAAFIGRFTPFVLGTLVLLAFPSLRKLTLGYLSQPVPRGRGVEVAVVALAKVSWAYAFMGALALWYWSTEGGASLEYYLGPRDRELAAAEAFSLPGMLTSILIGAVFAPLVEEVLFRGLLFDAWARRWGAFVATILTSALFASYHPHFVAAFVSAVIFVCVRRRTGTLWGSIVVHSVFNLMLWYPLAGQFGTPDPGLAWGDLATWRWNLACLLFVGLALPIYAGLAIFRPYTREDELA
jgi:membrane protease YdiL (CAAX protease family)